MQHLGAPKAHAFGIDVHLGHIIDDDGDPQPLAVAERMVRSVVLPEPRKPDRMVTGSLVSMAPTAAAGARRGSR